MPLVRKPSDRKPASTPDASGVLKALVSDNPDERWIAARSAAEAPEAASALASALPKESDPRVREAMFTSLARIGNAESVEAVLALLRSDNANLRTGALEALRILVLSVSGLLTRLLSDPDPDVRILSCELARGLPSHDATRSLCALLAGEQEVNVCAAAIDVLAEVGNADALPVLVECGQRFKDAPFIGFAIKIATDRIHSQSPRPSV
jgi:HEAT repeat protein